MPQKGDTAATSMGLGDEADAGRRALLTSDQMLYYKSGANDFNEPEVTYERVEHHVRAWSCSL